MVTLKEFIEEEVNGHIRDVILRSIEQGKLGNKAKDELVFNRYSLELYFPEGQVTIYDDVFSEDEPLSLRMEDFLKAIETLSTN